MTNISVNSSGQGITLIELLLVSREYRLDPERLIVDALKLARIDDAQPNVFLVAASYLKEHSIGVFDALHAVACGDRAIISSNLAR